jgi:hypothetical protein
VNIVEGRHGNEMVLSICYILNPIFSRVISRCVEICCMVILILKSFLHNHKAVTAVRYRYMHLKYQCVILHSWLIFYCTELSDMNRDSY